MKGNWKRKPVPKGGDQSPLFVGKSESNTSTRVRQSTKCSSRANGKHFSTMCFVCAKGRTIDDDVCRFDGEYK